MKGVLLTIMLVFMVACTSTPTGNVVGPENTSEDGPDENPFLNPGYHEINISEFYFKPKSITVYQGDRVKWINDMPFIKRVWIWGQEPSGIIRPGKSTSVFMLEAGFFKYRDFYYQDMEGNITVLPYEERPDVQARFAE